MLARLRHEPGVGLALLGSVVAPTDPSRLDLDFTNGVYGQPSAIQLPAIVARSGSRRIAGWLELDDHDPLLRAALCEVSDRVGEHELFAGPPRAAAREPRTAETSDGERFAAAFLAGVEATGASTAGLARLAEEPPSVSF